MDSGIRKIDLVRLTQVSPADVRSVLNEPRNARHMPLTDQFDEARAAAWITAKDSQWDEHGFGPWAVLVDGDFAGWGGFQREPNGADLALVLRPSFWGHGREVFELMLRRGFGELGIDEALIALPYTRDPTASMARLGFRPAGEVHYGGTTFRQYRLDRADWERRDAQQHSGGQR